MEVTVFVTHLGHPGEEGEVDLLAHGALPQVGLEDGHAGTLVRQRDVDQLVQTSGSGDNSVSQVYKLS